MTTHLHARKGHATLLFVICISIAALALFGLWVGLTGNVLNGPVDGLSKGILIVSGVVGLGLALFLLPYISRSFLSAMRNQPIVSFDARGITDHYSNQVTQSTFIPWGNVAAAGYADMRHKGNQVEVKDRLIIVEMIDSTTYDAALPKWRRRILRTSRRMEMPPNSTYINSAAIKETPEGIMKALQQYAVHE